jgi:hypothetical protein
VPPVLQVPPLGWHIVVVDVEVVLVEVEVVPVGVVVEVLVDVEVVGVVVEVLVVLLVVVQGALHLTLLVPKTRTWPWHTSPSGHRSQFSLISDMVGLTQART